MPEDILLPFQKPSRISTTQQTANTHIIQIYEDIGYPDEYRDELNLINNASEMDTIVIDLCTDGGIADTAMLFKRALFNTPAHTVAVIGPACSSAGSIIALSCREHVLDDTSSLMIHTSSYGIGGKDVDIVEHVVFSRNQLKNLYESVYSGFLSEEEITDVIKGTPFYFDVDQLAERLEAMYAYREANKAECDCENCTGESPKTLESIIEDKVKEILDSRETPVVKSPRQRKPKVEKPSE